MKKKVTPQNLGMIIMEIKRLIKRFKYWKLFKFCNYMVSEQIRLTWQLWEIIKFIITWINNGNIDVQLLLIMMGSWCRNNTWTSSILCSHEIKLQFTNFYFLHFVVSAWRLPLVRIGQPDQSICKENSTLNQHCSARSVYFYIVCIAVMGFGWKLSKESCFIFKMTGTTGQFGLLVSALRLVTNKL